MSEPLKQIILTGDRPTGRLHLGHYVGSLKRRVELQNSGKYDEINILIADDQALTDNADNPGKIRDNIINVVLDYLSVGLDPAKTTICIQSALPALHALTFYYMNLVTTARLSRNPTVKAEMQMRGFADEGLPAGFFTYPVSQAADITAGSREANQQLFNWIINSGINFDQIIDEKGYQWVHVSFNPNGCRKSVLHLS